MAIWIVVQVSIVVEVGIATMQDSILQVDEVSVNLVLVLNKIDEVKALEKDVWVDVIVLKEINNDHFLDKMVI